MTNIDTVDLANAFLIACSTKLRTSAIFSECFQNALTEDEYEEYMETSFNVLFDIIDNESQLARNQLRLADFYARVSLRFHEPKEIRSVLEMGTTDSDTRDALNKAGASNLAKILAP